MSQPLPQEPDHQHESAEDAAHIMRGIARRMTPPVGAAFTSHLLYTLGLMRIVGEAEGAAAVDRAGTGKIHRSGQARADDTIAYFQHWVRHGAASPQAAASIDRVQRMHVHYARSYPFSHETYVHGIALFTLLSDEILTLAGINAFTDREKAAQVQHWRAIGARMNIRDLPTTWTGMQQALRDYEQSPQWYRPTPAGRRSAEALIHQFNHRWLPRPLHRLGRAVLLSLHHDHVLAAIGQDPPPAYLVRLTRRALRIAYAAQIRLATR
ncbi:DUF2236 domain-containing protein [Streptomyces albireticuli]|nr:DUF2236 domain-containing protein [Streptomyces albireticuli]MCD9193400.1 DUF2236 domain-containing protein [Streptomyces albireticuli]